jgi:hypothetical protein
LGLPACTPMYTLGQPPGHQSTAGVPLQPPFHLPGLISAVRPAACSSREIDNADSFFAPPTTHNTFPMIQTKPSAARPYTCTPSYMHLLSFTIPCRCEMRASPCALAVDMACTWAHKPYLLPLEDPGACGACSLPQGWDSCCGSCWARNGRQIHGSKSMAT